MIFNPLTFLVLCAFAVNGQYAPPPSASSVTGSMTTAGASATTGTSASAAPSAVPSCISNCAMKAQSTDTCPKFTNTTCVCANTAYQQKMLACLKGNCTVSDQTTAIKIQAAACGTPPASSSTFTHVSPKPATSSGAAVPQMQFVGSGSVLSAMVAVFGAAVGFVAVL